MKTNLRSSVVATVTLVFGLTLVGGLLTSPRRSAVAEEPEPPADSPDQYVWTLVYRIATKPEGETVAVPMSPPHQIKIAYTFVKEFQVRADGTFDFEDCDFGHCLQEDVSEWNKGKVYQRTNWQGLLRGSGKWQPATADADEKLTLKLESSAAGGATETQMDGDDKIYVLNSRASIDGRTVTTTNESPGGKPIIYSYPYPFFASEWTLKPNKVVPDSSRGAIQGPGLNGIPVSFLAAPEDECKDKEEQKFEGGRPTTLICAAGPRTPVTETMKCTKAKKEADVGVTFVGGEGEGRGKAGGTGTVKVVVSNGRDSCPVNATLKVRVEAGDLRQHPPGQADSWVKVLGTSFKGNYHNRTVEEYVGFIEYNMTWQFTLAKGASETVEIEAQDMTPPGQTLPYSISFSADVTGDLPDPNSSNNSPTLFVMFDPPKKTPAKPK